MTRQSHRIVSRSICAAFLAGTMLAPVAAAAQDSDIEQRLDRLEAMIMALEARMDAQQADAVDAAAVTEMRAAVAKGTTTSKGLGHSYFANIFGPPQYMDLHEPLAEKTFGAALELVSPSSLGSRQIAFGSHSLESDW